MARIDGLTASEVNAPAWAGDFLSREHVLPGGARLDPTQFTADDAVVVTVGGAGAAQGATSIAVTALTGPIPSGTTLYFGAGEFARLTAAAVAGAVTLAVEALPNALEAADVATYPGAGMKKKNVPSGTLIGRTLAERDAGTGFGPAASTDDEIYLVAFRRLDIDRNADVELYRHGSLVKENFLPGWATMAPALQTAIRARYQCTIGAP